MAILYDTYFVVALSFVIFFAILWKYDVHGMLLRMLDERAERIRKELEDAKTLREEAQALLASYERRQKEVEETAAAIVARAKEDAAFAAEQAKKDLAASLDRRLRAATDQIAAAEAAAMREVKDRAVAVAVAAAADVLRGAMTPESLSARTDDAIRDLGRRLN
jgi:F-type H+-transporting ATPase subunit b